MVITGLMVIIWMQHQMMLYLLMHQILMYIKWLWGVILLIAVPLIWDGENIMLEFAR